MLANNKGRIEIAWNLLDKALEFGWDDSLRPVMVASEQETIST